MLQMGSCINDIPVEDRMVCDEKNEGEGGGRGGQCQ